MFYRLRHVLGFFLRIGRVDRPCIKNSCPSKHSDLKTSSNQLNVYEFFYTTPTVDWGFKYYFRYTEKNKKARIDTIIKNYNDSLYKIKNCSTLNDGIICCAGHLSIE